jgi:hypothetical protein
MEKPLPSGASVSHVAAVAPHPESNGTMHSKKGAQNLAERENTDKLLSWDLITNPCETDVPVSYLRFSSLSNENMVETKAAALIGWRLLCVWGALNDKCLTATDRKL